MKPYVYFVSYHYKGPSEYIHGFANCEAQVERPIETIADLKGIARDICHAAQHGSVVVLNYQLLRVISATGETNG